jgi:hypothetical protein
MTFDTMQILLEIRSGPLTGGSLPLAPGKPLRVGRNEKADHAFPDDKQMSGLHFAIEVTGKGCRILDLDSSNGTFLNGARVKEATLASGDEIRAGITVFIVRMLRDDALPAAKQPGTSSSHSAEDLEAAATPTPPSRPAEPPASRALKPSDFASFSAPSVKPTEGLPSSMPPSPASPLLKPGELPSFPAPSFHPVSVPVAPPAPKPPAPALAQPRLQDLLRKDFQPLYALLDASREPSVLKVIYESKEEFQSLYEGAQGAQLAHFAPYLIRIPEKSPLVETLVNQAWSKSWGVFLTCDKPLKDLRTHFRHFLNVKLPDGKQVYFRYYDPRVLRLFLPTCLPEEINQFFGPVKQFLLEAEDPKLALHFTRGPKGAAQKDLHLAPA